MGWAQPLASGRDETHGRRAEGRKGGETVVDKYTHTRLQRNGKLRTGYNVINSETATLAHGLKRGHVLRVADVGEVAEVRAKSRPKGWVNLVV